MKAQEMRHSEHTYPVHIGASKHLLSLRTDSAFWLESQGNEAYLSLNPNVRLESSPVLEPWGPESSVVSQLLRVQMLNSARATRTLL